MDAALWDRIAARAASQHGVVTRQQLRESGVSHGAVVHLAASGRLEAIAESVFVVVGSPATWRRLAFAAVAEAKGRGVLSHHAAAALWALPGFAPMSVHVLAPRGAIDPRTLHLARLHTTRRLPAHHVVELDGIRVTSPVRTVFDLSGVLPLGRLARLLDDAWGLKLVKADSLYDTLEELRGRGRGRVAWMRMLIEERGRAYAAPESGLERRFRRLLANDGQPPMEYQVDLGGESWIARVDAVDRQARLVVQIDSDRFHLSFLDRRHDEQQDAALRALGWTVIRITESDLSRRPAWVVAVVRAARSGVSSVARPA
jgi:very-short-patch-repair endonuclease